MKKKYKNIIAFVLTIIISFSSLFSMTSVNSYAIEVELTDEEIWQIIEDDYADWLAQHWYNYIADVFGFVYYDGEITNWLDLYCKFLDDASGLDFISRDEFRKFLIDNFSVQNVKKGPNGHSHSTHNKMDDLEFDIVPSDDAIDFVNTYVIEEYVENHGYKYVYSFDIFQYYTAFNDGKYFNALKDLCIKYQNDFYIVSMCPQYITNNCYDVLCLIPRKESACVFPGDWYSLMYYSKPNSNYYFCYRFNNTTWKNSGLMYSDAFLHFYYDGEKMVEFTSDNRGSVPVTLYPPNSSYSGTFAVKSDANSSWTDQYYKWITYGCTMQDIMYMTIEDAKGSDVGAMPYYITDSYNDGSYNTNSNNVDNSITYNNIQNYYGDYQAQNNGQKPTMSDLSIYINNYINNTNNNTGGGGSSDDGGGGSSNNGGGSSSGGSWDWSWLSSIGSFIGGLISAIGNALGGLLEALTSLIDGLVTGIPTIFGDFLGAVLGWLPPEILSVITLSIVAMILIGIIKILRG